MRAASPHSSENDDATKQVARCRAIHCAKQWAVGAAISRSRGVGVRSLFHFGHRRNVGGADRF